MRNSVDVLAIAARIFFWGYSLMLLVVGASGVFIAAWELHNVFAVNFVNFDDTAKASLLNQYRFVKSLELALGLIFIAFRNDIFEPSPAHRLFLLAVLLGVLARFGSVAFDGYPHPMFVAFALLELLTAVLVWAAVQRNQGLAS